MNLLYNDNIDYNINFYIQTLEFYSNRKYKTKETLFFKSDFCLLFIKPPSLSL